MRALDDTIAALGRPVVLYTVGATARPLAAIGRWRHDAETVEVMPSDAIRFAVSLLDGRNARSRGGNSAANDRRGSLSIFSPSEGISVAVRGEADILQLFLDHEHAEEILDGTFDCPPMFELQDDGMRSAVMRILVSSARHAPSQKLEIEQDLHGLAHRLAEHAAQRGTRMPTPQVMFRGGLAPGAFRRVEGIISAALADAASPSLAEMAAAADLSVTYFIRAFCRHTGHTPHRYLVRRRLDRAIALLRQPKIPVAEVADQVGFATTAHFVAAFRSTMGVTPASLREALI
jgi:AraC family transcriptional regulator